MPTVEAVYLSGDPMLLEDCEIVADVMAKIAISHGRLATHVVVIDPVHGRKMAISDIQIPKVEVVILNDEDSKMDIGGCKLNLWLHASQADDATCLTLLDTLRRLDPTHFQRNAARALAYMLFFKNGKWSVAAGTMARHGVSANIALRRAAKAGRADVVQCLVPDLADCNSRELGKRLLMMACNKNHIEVVRTLLDAGADVNSRIRREVTVLAKACDVGDADTVTILLDAGADVNSKDNFGETALSTAASNRGHSGVVKILLDADADVNSKNRKGVTVLAKACAVGDADTVTILLDAGADVNSKGPHGDAALSTASNRGHSGVVKILLDAGADVNSKDNFGETALSKASARRKTDTVKILLDAGARQEHRCWFM